MKEALAELELAPQLPQEVIDAGAEEELFGRAQAAAGEQLRQRWEAADGPVILQCGRCQESLKPLGRRRKQLRVSVVHCRLSDESTTASSVVRYKCR